MATKLELQTAPNSAIGTISLLLSLWERIAIAIGKIVSPPDDELILWRIIYNRHVETGEEFMTNECPPIPVMHAKVSLINKHTLWEICHYDNIIQFCCRDVMIVSNSGDLLEVDEESVVQKIAIALSQKK